MKRVIALLLAFVMLLSVAGCKEKEKMELPDVQTIPEPEELPEKEPESEKISLSFTKDEWPIIDGATAFLPFYQEMAAQLLGISAQEAVDYIMCSTTDYAYPYLWEKKVDMVFCLRPSEEQVARAAENGVVFEEVPFANEGFVFFVNKDNPVDSITVQQLHDIYAGKITNWKELGGNDEEIIAYQRTEGSGSQTGLYLHIISPDEIQEPPREERIGDMAKIIDAVAGYKNAAGAIGYSYRYFVTNMHYDDQIKMLKVEGVYPDYATIADGSYPLISDVCAVYREDAPADSAVRRIAQWCSSSEGAVLAKALGYVPTAEAVGTPYRSKKDDQNETVIKYAEGNPSIACTAKGICNYNNLVIESMSIDGTDDTYIQVSGLKNKTVQDEINKKIYDTFMELSQTDVPPYPGVKTHLAVLNNSGAAFSERDSIVTYVYGNFGNMLSVYFCKDRSFFTDAVDESGFSNIDIQDVRTLNLDLNTGREIYIGDLFSDNMDGVAFINQQISAQSDKPEAFDEPLRYMDITRDIKVYFRRAFEGINTNQKYYINSDDGSLNIVLDYENPEVANLFRPTVFSIDMREINAYGTRFMTSENLFEDETPNVCFFKRTDNGVGVIGGDHYDDEWSENRNISFASYINGYDSVSEPIIAAAVLNDARLEKLRTYVESEYDNYKQAGHSNLNGSVSIESYAYCYGIYTSICNKTLFSLFEERADSRECLVSSEEEEFLCFAEGSDNPISLNEIFVPDCDIHGIMEETAVRNLKDCLGNKYPDDTYRAMFREVLNHLDGFSVQEDSLTLYCADCDNIINRFVPSESEECWVVRNVLLNLSYKEIGIENLTIFN